MNVLDIFFPKRCVGCGRVSRYFCDRCRLKIRMIEPNEAICPVCEKPAIGGATHPRCATRYSPDGLTSFFRYDGIIRKAVKTIKYRLVSDLTHEFISLIPSPFFSAVVLRQRQSLLVPIPLHASRYRERGFNQADVLGRMVAERLKIPVRADMLRRTKKTPPQVTMKKRENRLKNMENVFMVSSRIPRSRILLFDDVFTTGATMRSAASSLKRSGAEFVWAITLAR